MSKNKAVPKSPVRVAVGPQAPGFARSMGESIGRIVRPMIPLSAFVLTFCGLSYLMWRPVYSDSATTAIRGRLQARTIRGALLSKPRPTWMTREDFEQVADLGLAATNHSVFDASLSRELAARYQTSSWVERVQQIRLRFPAQLELEVDWRKPVARVNGSTLVLDRSGYVLNLMSDSSVVREVPYISGLRVQRTEVGKQIPEKEVLAGLQLLAKVRETLAASPGGLRLVDLQHGGDGMWRLATDRGPYIYWGTFSEDPPMGEPSTQEKCDLLRRRLGEIMSKIGDPSLLEYIKVYMPNAPFKLRATVSGGDGVRPSDPATSTGPTGVIPAPSSIRRNRSN